MDHADEFWQHGFADPSDEDAVDVPAAERRVALMDQMRTPPLDFDLPVNLP